MSVYIAFPNGSEWNANSFAFRRLLLRYASFFPDDKPMQKELELVAAVGGISLKKGDPQTRSMLEALRRVAQRTIVELTEKGASVAPEGSAGVQDALRHYNRLLDLVSQAAKDEPLP